mmetsp:Transcript_31017/g.60500  ORF Transcript_31017/g.60500 Transcript_31017/m.60500 type:complete len:489 (+) Transcript_31017:104-1570(+)
MRWVAFVAFLFSASLLLTSVATAPLAAVHPRHHSSDRSLTSVPLLSFLSKSSTSRITRKASSQHAHGKSRHHGRLRHSQHSFPLLRSEIKPQDTRAVLKALKLRQSSNMTMLQTSVASSMRSGHRDIPLKKEVLSEKKLVTYFCYLSVGNQTFRILLDTGSSEFWIPSAECTSARCQRHRRYKRSKSNSLVEMGMSGPRMNIEYLSGRVEGPFVYETVRLGDIEVRNQIVGVASVIDIALLDDVVWDGILGLAYPSSFLLEKGVTPLFDNMMNQKVLFNHHLANQFSYYIDDEKGSITMGGANCQLINKGGREADCISKFVFVPVSDRTYWTINMLDVRVEYPDGREVSGLCPPGGCNTIVDTGTYLIYGPDNQFARTGIKDIDSCADYKNMPTMHFDFLSDIGEQVTLSLEPTDYILKFKMDANTDECAVGMSPDRDTLWTLGQVFLRAFYTVFDRDDDRIGFAPLGRRAFTAIHSSSDDKVEPIFV